jgi:hypothetical protein
LIRKRGRAAHEGLSHRQCVPRAACQHAASRTRGARLGPAASHHV